MSGAGAWRGGPLELRSLATGVLVYRIDGGALGPAAFERIVEGLGGRFVVTRRAPGSALFERGEGFERPRTDPFRSVGRGAVELVDRAPGNGAAATALHRPLRVTLSMRSHFAFYAFGLAAVWLIAFGRTNPLWWAIAWAAAAALSTELVRRRVGRRLRDWAEG